MADYDWFDRDEGPTPAQTEASFWRAEGLHPKWFETLAGSLKYPDYYQCRRGCGTLVWNPREHIANVCTEWSPVVG